MANANTAFILADARNVEEIVSHPETARLLGWNQPAAALYLSFLHVILYEDNPWVMVRRMVSHLAPGSYLAISHVASDDSDDVDLRQTMTELALQRNQRPLRIRKKQEIRAFFEGLELMEPGLLNIATWRPDPVLGWATTAYPASQSPFPAMASSIDRFAAISQDRSRSFKERLVVAARPDVRSPVSISLRGVRSSRPYSARPRGVRVRWT